MVDPLRQAIERELVVEREGWAAEQVDRATARLQQGVAGGERFETLVIWSELHTAFTAPGRTIYFARRLLERLQHEDATAFVIAHEIAHHRLGHVPRPSRAWALLPVTVVLTILDRVIAGPEQERDADLLAIDMCVEAGYDAERCLGALDLLHQVSLDRGDVLGALGPDERPWLWSRGRGYWSLRQRVEAVRAHLRRGQRLSVTAARDRERRRRRIALAGAAASAALGAALFLWRRRRRA